MYSSRCKTTIPCFVPVLKKICDLMHSTPHNTARLEWIFSCMNKMHNKSRKNLGNNKASNRILISMSKDLAENVNLDKVVDRSAIKGTLAKLK